MRVQERRNREMNLNSLLMTSQDASMKVAVSSSPFAAMLEEEKEIKRYSYELDELKRQIYDAGNMLEKSANMKEFQKFRDIIRSLNLSNAVAIVAYEAERQLNYKNLLEVSPYFDKK